MIVTQNSCASLAIHNAFPAHRKFLPSIISVPFRGSVRWHNTYTALSKSFECNGLHYHTLNQPCHSQVKKQTLNHLAHLLQQNLHRFSLQELSSYQNTGFQLGTDVADHVRGSSALIYRYSFKSYTWQLLPSPSNLPEEPELWGGRGGGELGRALPLFLLSGADIGLCLFVLAAFVRVFCNASGL